MNDKHAEQYKPKWDIALFQEFKYEVSYERIEKKYRNKQFLNVDGR